MNVSASYKTSSGIDEGTVTIVDATVNGRDIYVVYIDGSGDLKRDTKTIPATATSMPIRWASNAVSLDSLTSSGGPLYTPYWEDLRFPATAINPPGQASDPTFDISNVGWSFDSGSTETIAVIAQLPHSYEEGTDIYPHIHWAPSNTNTGTVLWRLSWTWTNNGDTQVALVNNDITVNANGTIMEHQVNPFTPLVKADSKISSILSMVLSRIGGSDTFTGNAILKEFDIHYQSNTLGSVYEFIK